MHSDQTFTRPSEAEIAQALSQIPVAGWPEDDDDLVALFDRMLEVLIGRRARWTDGPQVRPAAATGRRAPWWVHPSE